MLVKIIKKSMVFIFLIMVTSGCTILDDPDTTSEREKKRPGAIMTITKVVVERKDQDFELMVPDYRNNDKKICINRNSYLNSKYIEKIERMPNDKFDKAYDLLLYLDENGLVKYDIISASFRNKKLAILIDGRFYKNSTMTPIIDLDKRTVFISGPFDDATSKKVVEKSIINYNHYHNKNTDSFLNLGILFDSK